MPVVRPRTPARGVPGRWDDQRQPHRHPAQGRCAFSPLAQAFTVYRVGRRVGLKSGTTVAGLANDYAVALEEEFDGPGARGHFR